MEICELEQSYYELLLHCLITEAIDYDIASFKMPTSDYFPLALPGIINYIQANKPSDWASYFIGQIGAVEALIDRSSPDLTELSQEDSFALNPLAYFGALTASTVPSTALYMVASPLGRVHFIHHLTHSRLPDGSSSFYGLSQFGAAASLVRIPNEAFILPPKVRGLPAALILKRESFSTDGVPPDAFLQYSYRPLVPLPQFVSSFLLGTRMVDTNSTVPALDVLKALQSATASMDAAVPEDRDTELDWHTDSDFLVSFLFLANSAVENEFGVNLRGIEAAQASPDLAAWVSSCHLVLRGDDSDSDDDRKPAASSPPTTTADSTTPSPANHTPAVPHRRPHRRPADTSILATDVRRMLQDNHEVVEQLKQNLSQSLAVQKTLADAYTKDKDASAHTNKCWAKINADRRRMALAAASTDGENPARSLPATGLDFLASSVSSAKSVLEQFVQSHFPKYMVSYQSLLVLHFHSLLLIWSRSDVPDGFSVFFTPSSRPEVGDSRAAIMAGLEESNRAGFSAETVQAHTRVCTPSVPDSYTNLLHQVQNFSALFVIMFGENSRIAVTLSLLVDEIESNENDLSILLTSDKDFALKFLFNIDNVVQRFFRHILSHSIGVQATNILSELTDLFDDIKALKFHGPVVPAQLITLVRPASQPRQSNSDVASGVSKKRKVKNSSRNAHWTLRTGENFSIFSSQKASAPSILQTPICLKFHILGTCQSSCPRASTHIPLSGNSASQFSAFVNNCRSPSSAPAPGSAGPVTSGVSNPAPPVP